MRVGDVIALGLGLMLAVGLAAGILLAQGAGAAAYEDIMQYGRALATDTLPEPGAPSGLIRWLTGNADPSGQLPWPFGSTTYLVWWGTGSWPLWLAAVPATVYLLVAPSSSSSRRLVAAWTIAASLQVVLPGPLLAALLPAADPGHRAWSWPRHWQIAWPPDRSFEAEGQSIATTGATDRRDQSAAALILMLAIAATLVIQVRSYLLVPPQELTVRYKGGGQWVVLRALGKELARRSSVWPDPRLYIWGWQSPLHFYGKLDGVTRHFFVDNLLRDQAERDHPLIKPRIAEIMSALRDRPPALIFVGYAPFPELCALPARALLALCGWCRRRTGWDSGWNASIIAHSSDFKALDPARRSEPRRRPRRTHSPERRWRAGSAAASSPMMASQLWLRA